MIESAPDKLECRRCDRRMPEDRRETLLCAECEAVSPGCDLCDFPDLDTDSLPESIADDDDDDDDDDAKETP